MAVVNLTAILLLGNKAFTARKTIRNSGGPEKTRCSAQRKPVWAIPQCGTKHTPTNGKKTQRTDSDAGAECPAESYTKGRNFYENRISTRRRRHAWPVYRRCARLPDGSADTDGLRHRRVGRCPATACPMYPVSAAETCGSIPNMSPTSAMWVYTICCIPARCLAWISSLTKSRTGWIHLTTRRFWLRRVNSLPV